MTERAALLELGRQRYGETLSLQRALHARVSRGERGATWLVVEHDPVVTSGRNAKRGNLLISPEALAARGIDFFEVERGGDATYHGPGQIVVYPIVKLPRFREVVPFVSALESAVIDALSAFGIVAGRRSEHRGVYVGDRAICAVGLAVKQMTTLHGFALNVSTDLGYDRLITPCGTPAFGVTSMERELQRPLAARRVKSALLEALQRHFDAAFVPEYAAA